MYPFMNGGHPVPPNAYPRSEPPVPIQRHATQAFTWPSASDRGPTSGTADLGYGYNVQAGRQPVPASQRPQVPLITNNVPSHAEFQILPSTPRRYAMPPFASGRQNNPSLRPIPASSSSLDGWNRINGTGPGGDPQPPACHSFEPTTRQEQRMHYAMRPSGVVPINTPTWRTFPFEILPPDTTQQPVPPPSATHPSLSQPSLSYPQRFTVPPSRNPSLERVQQAEMIAPIAEVQHSPYGLLIPPPAEQIRVKSEPSSSSSSRRGSQDLKAVVQGARSSRALSDPAGPIVRAPKRKASSELSRSVNLSPIPSSPTKNTIQQIHQVIDLGEDDSEEQRQASALKKDKKPFLACEFCRNRKIACGPGPTYHMDLDLPPGPRTCNQCHRRELECKFPEASRRGLRDGRPSRRVVYGPDNQFKIIIVEEDGDDRRSLEWDEIVAREEAEAAKAQMDNKRTSSRTKGKPLIRCSWTPIRFVAAVDTDMIKQLVKEGRIPGPGGPPITK